MIDKVRITRFGQFIDREFELGPVTVFVGPNEAGKTTVFDALVEAICVPSEATVYGKQVKQRYGDRAQRIVKVEPSLVEAPDVVEFMNVQAFRSGNVQLAFSGKNWIERLRGALFTGGLNPSSMADQLRSEENRERKAGKRIEENLAVAQRSLAELQTNRQQVLERRALLKGDEERVRSLAVEENALRLETARLERALALQRRYNERRRTIGLLDAIAQSRRLEEELNKLLPFERDRSEEIASARRQEGEAQGRVAKAQAEAEVGEKRAQSLANQAVEAEARGREGEALLRRLLEVQALFDQALRPVAAMRTVWSTPMLVVAGATALAGLAAAVALRGSTGMVLLTIGIATGAVIAVLARKQRPDSNTVEWDRFVEARRAELAALLKHPIDATGAEGLAAHIAGAMAKARITVEAARTARDVSDQARRDRDDATAAVGPARSDASHAAAEVLRLFQAIGVANEEDLGAKRAQLAERRRALNETATKLSAERAEVGAESVDQLETLLRTRVADLERAIDGPELMGDAARGLESELAAQRQALDDKLAEERLLAERLAGEQGELRATLGKLPEDIAGAESRIAKLEADRVASVTLARADEFAAIVFDSVAQDTQVTVQLLAAEATSRLAKLVTGTSRSVEIAKLEDPESITMTDAGGKSRPLEHLSRGTRDALLFAVRLALAEKLAGSVRVLLLDDPFGALDPERIRGLLTLLDEFRKRADFQLIFFTKEPALLATVEGAFVGVRVHVLKVATAAEISPSTPSH